MKKNPGVFQRQEMKYLVTSRQREELTNAMRGKVHPDDFGKSTVCSVYYDTPDFLLIRRSIEKPVYKEKLRVRSYGRAQADDKVFVELKKKFNGEVFKRRVSMTQARAEIFLRQGSANTADSQIEREIGYFLDCYEGIEPAMYICCDRAAVYANDEPDVRITFDDNIRWRREALTLESEPGGKPLLPEGMSLMEVKAGTAIPLWLARKLTELRLFKTSFSKYGSAYREMLKEESGAAEGSVYCA